MGDRTGIEWTDATWNPIRGCTTVSEGCRNCYAMGVAARFSQPGQPYEGLARMTNRGPKWTGAIRKVDTHLALPLKWQRPRMVFVNSMSDLFHAGVPDEYIAAIIGVMAFAERHTFQVLTKRPQRMLDFLSRTTLASCLIAAARYKLPPRTVRDEAVEALVERVQWPLRNVWWGVSAEDQDTADERVPLLLQTPAAVRWVSAEPLLGPIDFHRLKLGPHGPYHDALSGSAGWRSLDWIVVGGESGRLGTGVRPMHPDWPAAIQRDCARFGVPFFFKQWGNWAPPGAAADSAAIAGAKVDLVGCPAGGGTAVMTETGKRSSGALLHGREWKQYPRGVQAPGVEVTR